MAAKVAQPGIWGSVLQQLSRFQGPSSEAAQEEALAVRNKYVGVSLPKVKAEATVGLLKGEDKHHVRLGTVWPCGTGKGQVFSTKAIQAEYATTLTDVQKIETTAGQRNDKLEFVEAPGSSASPNEFVLDQMSYSIYCVMDGHNGHEASQFCMSVLQKELHKRLPVGPWPLETEVSAQIWLAQIRAAMAFAMVAVERKFSAAGISSGATCTLILQTGWLLSVANLGDSTAYLDTGREVMRLTADHRVDESAPEQDRLKAFAPRFSVRRLAANMQGFARDGEGVGPLRLWPGGLAVSRSIGDFDVGEPVTCAPAILQVRVPESGCRIVLATDGLWDVDKGKDVPTVVGVRKLPTHAAAKKLLRRTGPTRVLSDDVTVVVVDILPAASDGPVPSFMGGSDAAAPKRGLFRMLRCFSKGASGVTEPRQAAAKSMARMKEDGPTTLSNGLIIPAGVEPGNTKFLFGDNDSDTSSNHEQSDTQSDMRFGRRSDTDVAPVVVLASADYAAAGTSAGPTSLDARVADFLRVFQAESRRCWATSVQLKKRNADPFHDPGIIRMCSHLQDTCSIKALALR